MAPVQTTLIRLLVPLLTLTLPSVSALLCLSCTNVTDVRFCQTFKECYDNQKCSSSLVDYGGGRQLYNLGCVDESTCTPPLGNIIGKRGDTRADDQSVNINDRISTGYKRQVGTTACHECCDHGDGCNKDLCSAVQTSLRCVTCTDAIKPDYCDKLSICGQDEYCFVQKTTNYLTFDVVYQMKCMGVRQCDALIKSSTQHCTKCCNDTDLCNYAACAHNVSTTAVPTSPTPVSTTPKPTAPPTTTPTTVPATTSVTTQAVTQTSVGVVTTEVVTPSSVYQLVITGPQNGSYLSHVELKCVSLPPAQSYIWKYNQVTTLPQGVYKETDVIMVPSLAGSDTLVISELNEFSEGLYRCIADINTQTLEANHTITIRSEKPTAAIQKSVPTTNFALVCNVTGYPIPHIGWAFVPHGTRTTTFSLPPDVAISTKGYHSALVVPIYRPLVHNGEWFCAASNTLGEAISSVVIP